MLPARCERGREPDVEVPAVVRLDPVLRAPIRTSTSAPGSGTTRKDRQPRTARGALTSGPEEARSAGTRTARASTRTQPSVP